MAGGSARVSPVGERLRAFSDRPSHQSVRRFTLLHPVHSRMLKSIDPILTPDLLATLRAMGHGDTIAIVDANFPAETNARRLIRLDGHGVGRVLDAVLSVMPLDDFGADAAVRMEVVGDAAAEMPIYAEFRRCLAHHEPLLHGALGSLERHAFYAAAGAAFAIVATGETQLYGNILLRKGVIGNWVQPSVA